MRYLLLLLLFASTASAAEKPNILLIFVDDHAFAVRGDRDHLVRVTAADVLTQTATVSGPESVDRDRALDLGHLDEMQHLLGTNNTVDAGRLFQPNLSHLHSVSGPTH